MSPVKEELRSPQTSRRFDTDDSMDDTSLIMDSFKQESSYNETSHFKEEPSSMDEDSFQNRSSMLSIKKEESDEEDSDAPLVCHRFSCVLLISLCMI